MRWPLICSIAAFAVGCSQAEEQPAPDQPAATSAVSAADFAGTWVVTGTAETSDSVLTTYDLTATASTDGWTSTLPGREPMPVRVVLIDADSIVTEAGPFESVLRPGVMTTTRSVVRLQGDMLVGTIVARYSTDGADSVLTGRLHGMRKPQ